MKIFLLSLLLILFTTNSISAAEDRQPKTISGKVRNADMSNARQVSVQIMCKNTTIPTLTNNSGNYSVIFTEFTCEQFDTVTVSVNNENLYGSTTRTVTFALTQTMSDIILTEQAPVSVPEFSVLSAIIASSSSLLAFSKLRKFR